MRQNDEMLSVLVLMLMLMLYHRFSLSHTFPAIYIIM